MNEKIIFEVLLKSYKDLEYLCKNCDRNILNWALKKDIDMFKSFEFINKYSIEKVAYCNIKVIFDEAVKKIKHNDELKFIYFQGKTYKELVNITEFKSKRKMIYGKEIKYIDKENVLQKRVITQKKNLFNYFIRTNTFEKLFNLMKDSITLSFRYNSLLKSKIKF